MIREFWDIVHAAEYGGEKERIELLKAVGLREDATWANVTTEELRPLVREFTNNTVGVIFGVPGRTVSYRRSKWGLSMYDLSEEDALHSLLSSIMGRPSGRVMLRRLVRELGLDED